MSNQLKKEEMDRIIEMQKKDIQQQKPESSRQEDPLKAFRVNAEVNSTHLNILILQQEALSKQLTNLEQTLRLQKQVGEDVMLKKYLDTVLEGLMDTVSMKDDTEQKEK